MSWETKLREARAAVDELTELRSLAVQQRDMLIVKRQRQGVSLRQLADEAGISHVAVAKIISRERSSS